MSDLEPKAINSKSLGCVQTQEMTLNSAETENYARKISNSEAYQYCHQMSCKSDKVLELFGEQRDVHQRFNRLTGAGISKLRGSFPMETNVLDVSHSNNPQKSTTLDLCEDTFIALYCKSIHIEGLSCLSSKSRSPGGRVNVPGPDEDLEPLPRWLINCPWPVHVTGRPVVQPWAEPQGPSGGRTKKHGRVHKPPGAISWF